MVELAKGWWENTKNLDLGKEPVGLIAAATLLGSEFMSEHNTVLGLTDIEVVQLVMNLKIRTRDQF